MATTIGREHRTVLVLATCQALFQTASVMIMTVGGLAGLLLAPSPSLATLPIASTAVGTALSTIPAALLMGRYGRRPGFLLGTGLGAAGGICAAAGLLGGSFLLLCLGNLLAGGYQAFSQFYRFAAAEASPSDHRSRAISLVLAGGVVAALAGPPLAAAARDWIAAAPFVGSYLAVILLSLAAATLLARSTFVDPASGAQTESPPRPLSKIARQPTFLVALGGAAIGYGVMILAMTATPLAMVGHHHGIGHAALVIQGHALGMFLPSFVTGILIQRCGVLVIMLTGVLLLAAHVVVALSGTALPYFFSALVFLGVGWNFLFIGGTTLLTTTYEPSERAKVQALNDFSIFGVVVAASFASGGLLHTLGWQGVNLAALPFLLLAGAAILGLALTRRPLAPSGVWRARPQPEAGSAGEAVARSARSRG